jgi:hypothetical protein
MHALRIVVQQAARTSPGTNQSTSERPERPERPERAEQPERPERPEVVEGALTREQLKARIRENIQIAQEAAQEASENAVIVRGPLPGDVRNMPGHTVQPPIFGDNVIPQQAVDISIGFFVMCAVMVVGWPLARAFGRRLERGAQTAVVSPALTDQLQRIEQAVDAMSIEVERISESQRFLAKLQSAQSAEPVALPGGERR